MRKKILNIKEKIAIKNSSIVLSEGLNRDNVLIVKESITTGRREVLHSLKISDYDSQGIAYGVIRKWYHQILKATDQQKYRILILNTPDDDELLIDGLGTDYSPEKEEFDNGGLFTD